MAYRSTMGVNVFWGHALHWVCHGLGVEGGNCHLLKAHLL